MSIFHHRAVFDKQLGDDIFYKYCPDTVEQKHSWGEFKFNVNDWQPIITLLAKPTGEIVVYVDETCVDKLTQNIKKHFERYGEFPKNILWIS